MPHTRHHTGLDLDKDRQRTVSKLYDHMSIFAQFDSINPDIIRLFLYSLFNLKYCRHYFSLTRNVNLLDFAKLVTI